ncbi:MAG: hypothetical protein P8L31_12960 [Pseudomonadales bacterium]|jgi:hypothetical protein|nr:hypothetical protein [Pseudomonadales bacterium]
MKYLTMALVGILVVSSASAEIKRTGSGKPDLSGFYDSGTLTPVDRPKEFGDKQFMSAEEAAAIVERTKSGLAAANRESDPDREAPVQGGDGNNNSGAGGVGGYNAFWVDPGSFVSEVNGQFRTSIVYDPPNGRRPEMTVKGQAAMAANFASFAYQNDGSASWLANKGNGPFDGPETLALAERCLLGFSAGPPSLPGLYNNFKRIIQTEDHVMILLEMVHDARVIRIDAKHAPDTNRKWLGDAIGWWEGDTLVVETINFKQRTGLYGGDENLHLIERFSRLDDGNLLYNFTVTDPTIWTGPWSGEFVWKASVDKVYEYACHEGNYAMGNILRGARILEAEYDGPRAGAGE